ncbi:Ldh family oxidoreductase [Leisingera aquimarina]|uniref:Ldh family oxidoreductase n=1 Tax=Leisingera aquimarina TaxID=476529 RepID=UPI000684C857|nr:Ldh family oxidoreductase [Leisingera aquimarina]
MPEIARDQLELLVRRYLVDAGCITETAAPVARAVVQAEAEGNLVCGLFYLPVFREQLLLGKVDGKALPEILKAKDGLIVVDARHGFAHPAIELATQALKMAARKNGVSAAGITNSYNALSLAHHVIPLAEAGLIGICCSNAQETIPPGWAQDGEGQSTLDPEVGLRGSLLPFGEQKGANIGLLVEILSAVLTGSNLSISAPSFSGQDAGTPNIGQFLLAINPAHFAAEVFTNSLKELETHFGRTGLRFPGQVTGSAITQKRPKRSPSTMLFGKSFLQIWTDCHRRNSIWMSISIAPSRPYDSLKCIPIGWRHHSVVAAAELTFGSAEGSSF